MDQATEQARTDFLFPPQAPVCGWAKFDALKPERDALAEELRELYPDAATKIVDLFVRIDANDKAPSSSPNSKARWRDCADTSKSGEGTSNAQS